MTRKRKQETGDEKGPQKKKGKEKDLTSTGLIPSVDDDDDDFQTPMPMPLPRQHPRIGTSSRPTAEVSGTSSGSSRSAQLETLPSILPAEADASIDEEFAISLHAPPIISSRFTPETYEEERAFQIAIQESRQQALQSSTPGESSTSARARPAEPFQDVPVPTYGDAPQPRIRFAVPDRPVRRSNNGSSTSSMSVTFATPETPSSFSRRSSTTSITGNLQDIAVRSDTGSIPSGTESSEETAPTAEGTPAPTAEATPASTGKAAKRKARAEALKKAREEDARNKIKGTSKESSKRAQKAQRDRVKEKYTIKSSVATMIRPPTDTLSMFLNDDQRNAFVTHLRRAVEHVRDVSYAVSLLVNWHCLYKIENNQPIPRLSQNYLYHFASLIVGLGRSADPDVRNSYDTFTAEMGPAFDQTRQFENLRYSSLLSSVMRSYEVMINNHVGLNFEKRTLRYFFTRFSSTGDQFYLQLPVGVTRNLAQRAYTAIASRAEMTYPDDLEITDAQRNSIRALIAECLARLGDLPLNEENVYANAHLYLPFLHHVLQRMEENISIMNPVPDVTASIAYVHRRMYDLVANYSTLRRRFRSALEHHVRDAINSAEPTETFLTRPLPVVTGRNRNSLDRRQRRQDTLTVAQRIRIQEFVQNTRDSIAARTFRPERYTDPRGARLFTLLPVYSMQMRYIPMTEQALNRILRLSGALTGGVTDMVQLCWRLFRMNLLGFDTVRQLTGNDESKAFTGAFRTDGVAIDFIFDRPRQRPAEALAPADVARLVDLNEATIWGVDPGQKDIFVASDGDSSNTHRIRRTSTSEYYFMAGYKAANIKRAKYAANNIELRQLISAAGSFKTASRNNLEETLRTTFQNFLQVRNFYNFGQRSLRFTLYNKRRRALTEICKRLLTGSEKYTNLPPIQQSNPLKWKPVTPSDQRHEQQRPIIIAFGAAQFGALRGNIPAPTNALKKALNHFVKTPPLHTQGPHPYGRRFLVMVDEYLTSQICPLCQTRTVANVRDALNNRSVHSVLNCQTCGTHWNRDNMASMNIRSVFLHMANNQNERPPPFQRPTTQ